MIYLYNYTSNNNILIYFYIFKSNDSILVYHLYNTYKSDFKYIVVLYSILSSTIKIIAVISYTFQIYEYAIFLYGYSKYVIKF